MICPARACALASRILIMADAKPVNLAQLRWRGAHDRNTANPDLRQPDRREGEGTAIGGTAAGAIPNSGLGGRDGFRAGGCGFRRGIAGGDGGCIDRWRWDAEVGGDARHGPGYEGG